MSKRGQDNKNSVKQSVRLREEMEGVAQERGRHLYATSTHYKTVCHNVALRLQQDERSDPHVFNRMISRFKSGAAMPADYKDEVAAADDRETRRLHLAAVVAASLRSGAVASPQAV